MTVVEEERAPVDVIISFHNRTTQKRTFFSTIWCSKTAAGVCLTFPHQG